MTITVERLDDGEVSPYLVDEVQVGDHLELRGPIGGYFVWRASLVSAYVAAAREFAAMKKTDLVRLALRPVASKRSTAPSLAWRSGRRCRATWPSRKPSSRPSARLRRR